MCNTIGKTMLKLWVQMRFLDNEIITDILDFMSRCIASLD